MLCSLSTFCLSLPNLNYLSEINNETSGTVFTLHYITTENCWSLSEIHHNFITVIRHFNIALGCGLADDLKARTFVYSAVLLSFKRKQFYQIIGLIVA